MKQRPPIGRPLSKVPHLAEDHELRKFPRKTYSCGLNSALIIAIDVFIANNEIEVSKRDFIEEVLIEALGGADAVMKLISE